MARPRHGPRQGLDHAQALPAGADGSLPGEQCCQQYQP